MSWKDEALAAYAKRVADHEAYHREREARSMQEAVQNLRKALSRVLGITHDVEVEISTGYGPSVSVTSTIDGVKFSADSAANLVIVSACPDCDGDMQTSVRNLDDVGAVLSDPFDNQWHEHWYAPDSTHPKAVEARALQAARREQQEAQPTLAEELEALIRRIASDEVTAHAENP